MPSNQYGYVSGSRGPYTSGPVRAANSFSSSPSYSEYLPLAFAGGQALGNLGAALAPAPTLGGGNGYLPYTRELTRGVERMGNNLGSLNAFIDEVGASQARPQDLQRAQGISRQEAAARGLDGGLAAGLSIQAQQNVVDQHMQRRAAAMSQLLGQRQEMLSSIQNAQGQIQAAEQARREMMFRNAQQAAAHAAAKRNAIFNTLGMLLGGGIGFLGGPMGAGIGAGLGGGLGSLLGGIFPQPYTSPRWG